MWEIEGSEGYLVQVRSPASSQTVYSMVELKGGGCAALQAELQGFMRAVDGLTSRWSGKRLDFRWDGHGISPLMMKQAAESGQFVSRSLSAGDWDWRENTMGQTCYLGGRSNQRHIRTYNARGFNRLELECSEDSADSILRKFIQADEREWPQLALAFLLATVDFREVDRSRQYRARRLAWWDEFVGQARKVQISRRNSEPVFAPLPIGRADDWVKRNRKAVMRIVRALGADWLVNRARYWSAGDVDSDSFLQEIERLGRFKGSGLCGTFDAGDLPI